MDKITTPEMEVGLIKYFDPNKNLIITNTFETIFESDVLVLSKSGYATGVEIKVSKADLKKDLKKPHISKLGQFMKYSGKSAKEHYFSQFKKFYYAVPEDLMDAALDQIPEWCGLLIASKRKNWIHPYIHKQREAQVLFRNKWSDSKRFQVARLGTIRACNLKEALLRQHYINSNK